MDEPIPQRGEITEMLKAWSGGNRVAMDNLVPLVYEELHRQARRYLSRERGNHTLQTTALVHAAYLRLIEYRFVDLLMLDKALNELATLDERQAQIIEL